MTLGQYRTGSTQSNDNKDVTGIRQQAANWIDWLENYSQRDNLPVEAKRLIAIAQTRIEEAAMWAVKAVTKGPRE